MQSTEDYPYLGFRFRIEIEGIIIGGFSEVSGLQSEIEVESIEEGGINDYVHKLPKKAKFSNIVLKRGITDSDKLWRWYENILVGIIDRKLISIILTDSEGNEQWRWEIIDAYPIKWVGSELKAETSSVAFESLEIVHNGITRVRK
jgi:phage tail-like protein